MYHRFSQHPEHRRLHRSEFERQLDVLHRQFRVVSLGEYGGWLAEGRPVPPRVAIITVDDGYRDFYEVAYPLLRERGLPATLFVATDAVDHGAWLWPDRVEYVLDRTVSRHVVLEAQGYRMELPVGDAAAKQPAWAAFVAHALAVPNESRLEMLRQLEEAAGVAVPAEAAGGYRVCNWAELRELASHGIEIGGHTRSHPVVSRLDPGQLDDEIAGCRARLAEKLGVAPNTFCYPNGMPGDVNAEARLAVQRAGYVCAVVAHSRYSRSVDRFLLERIAAGPSERYFDEAVFGLDHARTWLGARATMVQEST
ncbi:MAG: polysaccharide deacetylase family protein [Steroidobacteraceae bacterium]|nr:polysaccharide deacetylase family protein [Steroidobacteraceae bacterium]